MVAYTKGVATDELNTEPGSGGAWLEATGDSRCEHRNGAGVVIPIKEFDLGNWPIRFFGTEDRAEKAQISRRSRKSRTRVEHVACERATSISGSIACEASSIKM